MKLTNTWTPRLEVIVHVDGTGGRHRIVRVEGEVGDRRQGLRTSPWGVLLEIAPPSAMLYWVRPQPLGTDALVRDTAGYAPCRRRPES